MNFIKFFFRRIEIDQFTSTYLFYLGRDAVLDVEFGRCLDEPSGRRAVSALCRLSVARIRYGLYRLFVARIYADKSTI